jgi:N-acetylglucosamine kinase-like BadF-type ATPase
VEKILRRVWPSAGVIRVMEDTRSVLVAAFGDGPGIVVIAGTGSNVAGQKSAHDPIEKAGGWGHLFSDEGSAYDIARCGMQLAYDSYDATRKISLLAKEFLIAAGKSSMEELVPFFLQDTSKTTVAQWARCVFAAAQKGDRDAKRVLDSRVGMLEGLFAVLAYRLKLTTPHVALTGGLFENQPDYAKAFQRELKKEFPGAKSFVLTVPGVFGAARLAGMDGSATIGSRRSPSDGPAQGLRRLPYNLINSPTLGRAFSFATFASSGRSGRSRSTFTRQRKPSGSSVVARNWCHVIDGTWMRSLPVIS